MKEIEQNIPPRILKEIAEKELIFYVIDAQKIAKSVGMAKRTNTVMQVAFFHLSKVLPPGQALDLLAEDIRARFKHKGEVIIKKNLDTLEVTVKNLIKVEVPSSWKDLVADEPLAPLEGVPDYVNDM